MSSSSIRTPANPRNLKTSGSRLSGHVMEIFSAIQGEGPWVGVRQIFIRFFRCNLRCRWCDTPESFALTGKGQVEVPPGSRKFKPFENPVSPAKTMKFLAPFLSLPHHGISITGGEPLLQKDYLSALLPELRSRGEKIFLETGGTLPELLRPLLDKMDFISMDLKLPSSAGERELWGKHAEFLKLARKKECAVKIVLTRDTLEKELIRGIDLVAKISPGVPVILQPVTRINGAIPPGEVQMLRWQDLALSRLPDVRVIPQTHKQIGQK